MSNGNAYRVTMDPMRSDITNISRTPLTIMDNSSHLGHLQSGLDNTTTRTPMNTDMAVNEVTRNVTFDDVMVPNGGLASRLTPEETKIVHSVAIGSLSVSLIFSLGVVTYMLYSGRDKSFYRRKIAERLVFYLALCDLCYSTEHIIDHGYVLALHMFPPDAYCTTLAFFLQEFAVMQGIIVLFTAVNACALIWRERRLSTGRYDWRLLVMSLLLPALQGVVCIALGAYGPSEAWCFTDKRKAWTVYVDLYLGITFLIVFIADIFCYALVFYKIQKISNLIAKMASTESGAQANSKRSTVRSARTMCIFVLAYIFQWFGYMIYSMWSLVSSPPVWLLVLAVLVTNMGGTYNCIAYTLVRRIGAKGGQSKGTMHNSTSLPETCIKNYGSEQKSTEETLINSIIDGSRSVSKEEKESRLEKHGKKSESDSSINSRGTVLTTM